MWRVRALSCYSCDLCLDRQYTSCANSDQLGEFKDITVKLEKCQREILTDDEIEEVAELKDMVHKDAPVAVVAAEPEEDYYLLNASGPPEILSVSTTDKWGVSYPTGTEV